MSSGMMGRRGFVPKLSKMGHCITGHHATQKGDNRKNGRQECPGMFVMSMGVEKGKVKRCPCECHGFDIGEEEMWPYGRDGKGRAGREEARANERASDDSEAGDSAG
jgi:hypothetical protein